MLIFGSIYPPLCSLTLRSYPDGRFSALSTDRRFWPWPSLSASPASPIAAIPVSPTSLAGVFCRGRLHRRSSAPCGGRTSLSRPSAVEVIHTPSIITNLRHADPSVPTGQLISIHISEPSSATCPKMRVRRLQTCSVRDL